MIRQVALLLLVAVAATSISDATHSMQISHPIANVLDSETFVLSGWDDIQVKSEFPVTSLRYNDHQYLHGGTPISENELVVVITSDCTHEELGGGVPTISYNDAGTTLSIGMVTATTNATTTDIDDLTFLESLSSFWMTWTYESYWCNFYENEDPTISATKSAATTNGGDKISVNANGDEEAVFSSAASKSSVAISLIAVVAGSLFFSLGGSDNNKHNSRFLIMTAVALVSTLLLVQGQTNNNTTSTNSTTITSPICKINVEILNDGCRSSQLLVTAPAVRMADVVLQNDTSSAMEECATIYEANLTFPSPDAPLNMTTNGVVAVPQLPYDACFRMVEGRPFIAENGQQIQAQAVVMADSNSENGWCTTTTLKEHDALSEEEEEPGVNTMDHMPRQQQQQRHALGQEWTRRALGEHASVSSFAAFTMALMANNAPPQLVQDSLTAAADEVRHAQVSFEMASTLLGQRVEPGPLPASSHTFTNNLTTLALATAQEGCMDETLAAIMAALEVDYELSQYDYLNEKERDHFVDVMTTIAKEEARHSALAWRTIQWVCGKDESACEAVGTIALDKDHLHQAVERRVEGRSPILQQKAKEAFITLMGIMMTSKKQGFVGRLEGGLTGIVQGEILKQGNGDTSGKVLLERAATNQDESSTV